MRFDRIDPPRRYEVGWEERFEISDCGRVHLEPDEQVTFVTPTGGEFDVTRKDWGFYAAPSLNGRLRDFGLRTVLVRNRINRYFILLVEDGHDATFGRYLEIEDLVLVAWLDSDESLGHLEERLADG
jgi:hypothetical protein